MTEHIVRGYGQLITIEGKQHSQILLAQHSGGDAVISVILPNSDPPEKLVFEFASGHKSELVEIYTMVWRGSWIKLKVLKDIDGSVFDTVYNLVIATEVPEALKLPVILANRHVDFVRILTKLYRDLDKISTLRPRNIYPYLNR